MGLRPPGGSGTRVGDVGQDVGLSTSPPGCVRHLSTPSESLTPRSLSTYFGPFEFRDVPVTRLKVLGPRSRTETEEGRHTGTSTTDGRDVEIKESTLYPTII